MAISMKMLAVELNRTVINLNLLCCMVQIVGLLKGFVVVFTCYMLDATNWMFLKLIFFKSSSVSLSEVLTTDNIVITRWIILANQPRINIEQ